MQHGQRFPTAMAAHNFRQFTDYKNLNATEVKFDCNRKYQKINIPEFVIFHNY